MERPFEYGWDKQHGGLYYFLDADGWSPVQLEWDMKLWWAHNEALIAFLMAYQETRDKRHLDRFAQIFDYSYSHVKVYFYLFSLRGWGCVNIHHIFFLLSFDVLFVAVCR